MVWLTGLILIIHIVMVVTAAAAVIAASATALAFPSLPLWRVETDARFVLADWLRMCTVQRHTRCVRVNETLSSDAQKREKNNRKKWNTLEGNEKPSPLYYSIFMACLWRIRTLRIFFRSGVKLHFNIHATCSRSSTHSAHKTLAKIMRKRIIIMKTTITLRTLNAERWAEQNRRLKH